jgi:EF-P beta-lysylation protein EpmB
MNNLIQVSNNDDWQHALRNAVTRPEELLQLLKLPNELLPAAKSAAELFPLRVPREFVSRIEVGNENDPLLRQILPIHLEHAEVPGYSNDPLEEASASPVPGLVHKYKDRVLLITSGACAINCRYCFRRHYPYEENQLGGTQWQFALQYIKENTDLKEVIFSGGDPLVTSDTRLLKMLNDLESIEHLERVRFHTRFPVVIPARITEQLCQILANTRLNSVVVLHINHSNEIDPDLGDAISKLKSAGATVLNQAVLLKGVNDTANELATLSHKLFNHGALPYYLFLFDPVAGASHFDVGDEKGLALYKELQAELPGYLLPKLAKEIPGRSSKTLIT